VKAAAFRREFELLPLPVGSLPTSVTCPLRSTSITPASSLVRSSPPLSGASVLSASRDPHKQQGCRFWDLASMEMV
jgi:hypothetical protein